MKKGSVLLESLVFLVLSVIMFLLVLNGIDVLWKRQRLIEKRSEELALRTSIYNVKRKGKDVPLKLKRYLKKEKAFCENASESEDEKRISNSSTAGGNGGVRYKLRDNF